MQTMDPYNDDIDYRMTAMQFMKDDDSDDEPLLASRRRPANADRTRSFLNRLGLSDNTVAAPAPDVAEQKEITDDLDDATAERRSIYYELIRQAQEANEQKSSVCEKSTGEYIPNNQIRNLINKVENNEIDTKCFTDIDDPLLLDRMEKARQRVKQVDNNEMPLEQIKGLYTEVSTLMSHFNGKIESLKNQFGIHTGNLNTCVDDIDMLSKNSMPSGYSGNLRTCLGTLQNKIKKETGYTANDTITSLRKDVDVMFFKFSMIYDALIKRINIYEDTVKTIIELSENAKPTDDLTLDSQLE